MQEYVYYNPKGLDFPIDESILVTTSLQDSETFLFSNTDKIKSEVVLKEIDFYISNTKDNFSSKIQNIKKLYDIASIKFDYAQDVSYTQEVGNKLLLIGDVASCNSIKHYILADEFDLYQISEDMLENITGHIGNLEVSVNSKDIIVKLQVDQIIYFDAKEVATKQSGTLDPNILGQKECLEIVRKNISEYEYKKFTTYDKNICQYHERRGDICGKCVEVCPTVAIVKDETNKHLVFSQIDCHGCGGCISVCPSGALDYTSTNRDALYEISLMYKNHIPLIIPAKMDIQNIKLDLKEGVLPFMIDGEKFLHESSFLTLLQLSGSQVIFYTDFISKGSGDSIRILNDIYQKRYGKDAIIVAKDLDELKRALEEVSVIDDSYFNINQAGMKKREIFATRLENIVKSDDLGVVLTGEHIHYAHVRVDEAKCTLCLSCVGACNVNALWADSKTNELKLNPSVCTACGYCELSCPEKECLSIEKDVIKLNPSWFKSEVLAKDKLFACVECGKEFATVKAIEKVASKMIPIFADPIKERTLYCCEQCKPKVMMKDYVNQMKAGNI
ncbi:4Fe-4S binding protein [Arcobacter sp. FWKO B]|uniref:4Fe-4S binding protein n=1 Tax=Arcobacter sp. FWKO B TaxID=2593672 RepID=UPI0018A4AD7C|nr:4Fe-4S binding protein [Arcobacter sp. FWKO B]QOG11811.1 4Fe-4S dicluster domain-containing protein [Arcobacter sp. FWKO B]